MEKSEITKKLDAEREKFEANFEKTNKSVLTVKPASQWMKEASSRPTPKQLLGSLFHEQELCILFADTNVGKSILAVQLADALSKGKGMLGLQNEAGAKKVLYLDFELSDKQFQLRYTINGVEYLFHENFSRCEINIDFLAKSKESIEKLIIQAIETNVLENNIEVVIVDNITFLGNEMEKSKNALPLMKDLQALKKKHQLSFLILAHTPKKDPSKPISNNDVAGSKMLMNFADSSFAIGKSSEDSSIRYIKQIKVRNCEEQYGFNNVLVCEIIKPNSLLKFNFIDYDSEQNHLENYTVKNQSDQEFQNQIKSLLDTNPDISLREIASKIGSTHPKVGRHIEKMKKSGMLE